MKAILGYKRGMARLFDDQGLVVPVTVIETGPCTVTQVRTTARDGYAAVQLGIGEVRKGKLSRPQEGHLRASGGRRLRDLREFRLAGEDAPQVGSQVDADVFDAGERIHVTGVSRGLGFAGTVKRHGFGRQRKSHGQTDRERAPGSIGAGTSPGRTWKGQRMAGRMGGQRVTVRNLEVVLADPRRHLLAVRGAVPGPRGGLVLIRSAGGK
jgi:large subunit ribosomal protein L3